MKFVPHLSTLILCSSASFLGAELLFYEPFDYPAETEIDGQTPELGAGGAWTDTSSGDGTPSNSPVFRVLTVRANATNGGDASGQTWSGIPEASTFPNTGGYLEGMRRDNNEGNIPLAASVTSRFTDGSTIWLSYVAAATTVTGATDNHHEPTLAIGAEEIGGGDEVGGNNGDDRARTPLGEAVGAGSKFNNAAGEIEAMYWDDESVDGEFTQFFSSTNLPRVTDPMNVEVPAPQQLIIVRIEFGSENEVITTNVFGIDPFTVPTLAEFEETAVTTTTVNNLDQSMFDTLSFDAVRSNLDEIRIGTEFEDMFGGSDPGVSVLAITEIVGSGADGSVTIRWNSRPGVKYVVEASVDLTGWFGLDEEVFGEAESDSTTFTESIEDDTGLSTETTARYYRVRVSDE
jgi:hypothetical protein